MVFLLQIADGGYWRHAQAVDCLLCNHEALSSNPSLTKKHTKKEWWSVGGQGPVPPLTKPLSSGKMLKEENSLLFSAGWKGWESVSFRAMRNWEGNPYPPS
jgi:hypothetical protein